MNRPLILITALLLCATGAGFGSFSRSDVGKSGAQFLKLGAGARATAMGGAFTAVADDATAVYWNPAGIAALDSPSASLMHAAWFEDIFYDWASYVHPTDHSGIFGLGVQYLSYGKITETDTGGLETGSFAPNDSAVTFSYAFPITAEDPEAAGYSDILLGASVKYISSTIKSSAQAFAADFGGIYAAPGSRFSLGLAVQNIGTGLAFPGGEDPLPSEIRLGACYRLREPWLVSFDVNAPFYNELYYSAGTEYSYMTDLGLAVTLRGGFSTLTGDVGGLAGASAGIGLRYMQYGFDYAFVPFGDLGNTHRISFDIKF